MNVDFAKPEKKLAVNQFVIDQKYRKNVERVVKIALKFHQKEVKRLERVLKRLKQGKHPYERTPKV